MSNRQPWERQNDTPKSWAAFCIYRDMGKDRSIDKAYQTYKRQIGDKVTPKNAPRGWDSWSAKYNWVRRAAAYDSHLDDLERAQYEKEKLKARAERHQLIRLAKSKLPAALEALTKKDPETGIVSSTIKPNEAINLMRLVLQEERAEYDDEPTQRHEHSGPEGKPIPVDVIDETLRKVYGEKDKDDGGNQNDDG